MRPDGADFPFDTVLVANRGEIAARVLRTVRALGLRGLVVHHAADAGSPAVRMADGLVEITGPTPTAAYLDAGQIIAKALDARAQAIHPGYGFLSENADFARQIETAGMVFVGPAPETIDLLGDKVSAAISPPNMASLSHPPPSRRTTRRPSPTVSAPSAARC